MQISQKRLREVFEYDDESGCLIARVDRGKVKKGERCGCYLSNGYRFIGIDYNHVQEHRLIWILLNGRIPRKMQIDHIDGDRGNNHIGNLRLVTQAENRRNLHFKSLGGRRIIGVNWYPQYKRWQAYIGIGGKQIFLGYFRTSDDAIAARRIAEQQYGLSITMIN